MKKKIRLNRARRGVIKLPFELLETEPNVARQILSKVLIVRAESMFQSMMVVYDCFCPQFAEVHPYEQAPEYDVEVSATGKVRFSEWRPNKLCEV